MTAPVKLSPALRNALLHLHSVVDVRTAELIGACYSVYYHNHDLGQPLLATRIADVRKIVNEIDAKLKAVETALAAADAFEGPPVTPIASLRERAS